MYLCTKCEQPVAALDRHAASWFLCFDHLLEHLATKPRRQKHPIYGDDEPYTCYGDAGRCPNKGDLYPGGPYCEEHRP